jgi:hypothetical protein
MSTLVTFDECVPVAEHKAFLPCATGGCVLSRISHGWALSSNGNLEAMQHPFPATVF